MVIGYHLIWTAYGSWLPNDPRGSSSHEIRCADIVGLGELHHGRRKVQPAARDIRKFYESAQQILKHELLKFSNEDVRSIAEGFADVVRQRTYTCYACAIMTDHVHLLIRYIDDNPIKAHRPRQKWDFVTPYDGWLPGLAPR